MQSCLWYSSSCVKYFVVNVTVYCYKIPFLALYSTHFHHNTSLAWRRALEGVPQTQPGCFNSLFKHTQRKHSLLCLSVRLSRGSVKMHILRNYGKTLKTLKRGRNFQDMRRRCGLGGRWRAAVCLSSFINLHTLGPSLSRR